MEVCGLPLEVNGRPRRHGSKEGLVLQRTRGGAFGIRKTLFLTIHNNTQDLVILSIESSDTRCVTVALESSDVLIGAGESFEFGLIPRYDKSTPKKATITISMIAPVERSSFLAFRVYHPSSQGIVSPRRHE